MRSHKRSVVLLHKKRLSEHTTLHKPNQKVDRMLTSWHSDDWYLWLLARINFGMTYTPPTTWRPCLLLSDCIWISTCSDRWYHVYLFILFVPPSSSRNQWLPSPVSYQMHTNRRLTLPITSTPLNYAAHPSIHSLRPICVFLTYFSLICRSASGPICTCPNRYDLS